MKSIVLNQQQHNMLVAFLSVSDRMIAELSKHRATLESLRETLNTSSSPAEDEHAQHLGACTPAPAAPTPPPPAAPAAPPSAPANDDPYGEVGPADDDWSQAAIAWRWSH